MIRPTRFFLSVVAIPWLAAACNDDSSSAHHDLADTGVPRSTDTGSKQIVGGPGGNANGGSSASGQGDRTGSTSGGAEGSSTGGAAAGGADGPPTPGSGGTDSVGSGGTDSGGTGGAGSGGSGSSGTTSGSAGGKGGTTGAGGRGGTGGSGGSKSSAGGTTSSGGTSSAGGTTGAGGTGVVPLSYTTNFDLTESPISEGGVWIHTGQDWTTVATANGNAYGMQALSPRSGASVYNDSYAYLTGYPANQSISVTIHLPAGIDTSTTHEVEILLRWADSAHNARGYECNLAYNGAYAEIVRWNGALGSYTYVSPQGSGGPGAVHDGDVFSAKIVGNTITTYLNGKQLATANDSTFATGNPGIGFYRGSSGAGKLGDYGFSTFTATALP